MTDIHISEISLVLAANSNHWGRELFNSSKASCCERF